jgi:ABC-type dipeptide/oligopeptide/nickel transport system permease component
MPTILRYAGPARHVLRERTSISIPPIIRRPAYLLGCLLGLFLIAGLPEVFYVQGGVLHVDPLALPRSIAGYVHGLFTGESFTYGAHWASRSFIDTLRYTLPTSLRYSSIALTISLLLGLSFGVLLGARRREAAQDLLGGVGVLPDFVLALLLQIAVVAIFKETGLRLARTASISVEEQAVLLPLIVLSVLPTVYLMRDVSHRVFEVSTKEYVLVARAQGLSTARTTWRHVLPHALVHVRANATKLAALMLGNLFIVEYLFNLRGVTRLLFAWAGSRYYEFALVFNSLVVTIGLFFILVIAMRLLLSAIQEAAARL